MSKDNIWIYKGLDVGLAVNDNNIIDVTIKDDENGICEQMSFNRTEEKTEDIKQQIGESVYNWISLMIDQIEEN